MGTYILIGLAIILVAAVVSYGISEWSNVKKATAVNPEITDLDRKEFERVWREVFDAPDDTPVIIRMEDADE